MPDIPGDPAQGAVVPAPFPVAELDDRLARVRAEMTERGLDALVVSTPENVYYLCGLDHWGYFAPHLLIVRHTGRPALITREMERVTIETQVTTADFFGHTDSQGPADFAVPLIVGHTPDGGGDLDAAARAAAAELAGDSGRLRVGLETAGASLPPALADTLRERLPRAEWHDISGVIDTMRQVKSPREQEAVRAAARVTVATKRAALEAARPGATEREVAAACHAAMIRAGGTYPGFGPFVRHSSRMGEEHTSWEDNAFAEGDRIFLELSGCVRRYHAPTGRLVTLGETAPADAEMAAISRAAFDAVIGAMRPGVRARDVYAAWQGVVDEAGMPEYRRHHCGYLIGTGFPPSWAGGNKVTGLRHDSDLELREGMSFHVLSWLTGTGRGDCFLSDTVLLGPDGPEVLTREADERI